MSPAFNLWDIESDGGYGDIYLSKIDFGDWRIDAVDLQNEDKYVLMQFIGLLDKNEKEIYEGDIVIHTKMINGYDYGEGKFTVEFGNLGCDYHGGIGFNLGDNNPLPENYEIIGDVFENPEFFKD